MELATPGPGYVSAETHNGTRGCSQRKDLPIWQQAWNVRNATENPKTAAALSLKSDAIDAQIFPNEYSMATVGRLIQIEERDCASPGMTNCVWHEERSAGFARVSGVCYTKACLTLPPLS